MFRKSKKTKKNKKAQPVKAAAVAPEDNQSEVDDQQTEEWSSGYEGQLAIDVYQTPDSIVIKSTIAGVSPEDIGVTVDNDMVTIKGERKSSQEVKKDNYYYQECYWGSFSRSVILPVDVESDKIEAELKNGILTVVLPKAKKERTTKVEVRAV
ncbi:MAG: Hsp20/alpha crystallin family protein [Parcubacteria group bacterium]|nr:Hsp20/alpha crystallin family protein [Parcubacteria group bacterium]